MATDAGSPQCRHNLKHVEVRLDHGPRRKGVVERAGALPFEKQLRKGCNEVGGSEPSRALSPKDGTEELVNTAPGPEEGLPRLTALNRWPLNDSIGVEQDCLNAQ